MAEIKFFDPSEMVRGIQQLLISDKKKIAFLFGAGTSLAKKETDSPSIPAIGKMTEIVLEYLKSDADKGSRYKIALDEIDEELEQQGQTLYVESLLTNIEDKIRIIGKGRLNDLTKEDFEDIREKICEKIQEIVSVHKSISGKESTLIQYDFAKWVCNADRKYAVEIFTTNYDYLFEIGLETNGVPYFDGFTGSYKPFFNADAVEDVDYMQRQTKLWKIHGSLGLHRDNERIIRMSSDKDDLLIYPSSLKYADSKKQPYSAFMDRLNLFLKQDDTVLFICGYSFGDEHINERILTALQTNTTSHVFVMYYDITKRQDKDRNEEEQSSFCVDCNLGRLASQNRKISVLATRSAIIGGQFGEWKINHDIDHKAQVGSIPYFKADTLSEDIPDSGESVKKQFAACSGQLLLPDFVNFVGLLKSMIPRNEWEGGNSE